MTTIAGGTTLTLFVSLTGVTYFHLRKAGALHVHLVFTASSLAHSVDEVLTIGAGATTALADCARRTLDLVRACFAEGDSVQAHAVNCDLLLGTG